MVFCSIQEAYGTEFETTRASYNSPPCSSKQFNPNDPYFALAGASPAEPTDVSVELENLKNKLETFVSAAGNHNENFSAPRQRLENILHYTLVAIFAALVVDNFK